MRIKYFIYVVSVVLILFLFVFYKNIFHKSTGAKAVSQSFALSTDLQWQEGTKNNLTEATGSISIENLTLNSLEINLVGKATSEYAFSGDSSLVIDGNPSTFTSYTCNTSPCLDSYWEIDLGQVYTGINGARISHGGVGGGSCSVNGTDWTACYTANTGPGDWTTTGSIYNMNTFRYFKFHEGDLGFGSEMRLLEFRLFQGVATATHTTAPTQIDGGTNFWEWESFADTKTVPANTSVTYRYRTSSDGSTDWTAWVSAIGSVTSRVGDTKYRYLQVEATLANTDGTSTPTINQYDIGYHTETKPTKPTAQTAVTQ